MVEKKTVKKIVKKAAAKPVVKKAAKPIAKVVVKAPVKPVVKVAATLSVVLYDATGKETGTVKLPEAVFGAKINKPLMAQAVRVYLANQRMGAAVTKTRSEVTLTTAKWYRQKGTGRARHGAQSAPIFVGGGTAHGPKAKDYSLQLSSQMKRAATLSSLSAMAKEGNVKVVAGLSSVEPKTKLAAKALIGMGLSGKKALVIMPEHMDIVFRAYRNIDRVKVARASLLTTYDILNAGTLVVMQETLAALEKQFKKESK
ncbi:MAG TPA: 50S ribosomal protein L4 [Candidatus Eisenbacteria bacterium]|nr:50S ribosomal protein L4 [Candidatus Eisenbacteria bacterium]